jgi:hypothetical protein
MKHLSEWYDWFENYDIRLMKIISDLEEKQQMDSKSKYIAEITWRNILMMRIKGLWFAKRII